MTGGRILSLARQTTPYDDQNPGTSGLRKKVKLFQQPHYLENFVQSIFDSIGDNRGKMLIIGGDGRYYNRHAIDVILKMAAANGFGHVKVGRGGILSTPAVSHLIRKYGAKGGIILSASHNPGGQDGDFGIKYNVANGGSAPESVTREIYKNSQSIQEYFIGDDDIVLDIDKLGSFEFMAMKVEIIDPVEDYATLMESLFDFDAIRTAIKAGLTLCFDAMHAVTGPYAHEIFEKRLGFKQGSVINGVPMVDFNGHHPDPNLSHAKELYKLMMSDKAPDLGAASDGDGDRNLIIGKGQYVTPSDSLAILTANAPFIKAYDKGVLGVARSMPTSRACDVVAQALGFACYETPTGWKFFGNLLDDGRITFCGEESFGTGSNHLREKDGLWAVLFWLNLISVRQKSVKEIVANHWHSYGRHYYMRHDYEEVDSAQAGKLMAGLQQTCLSLKPGTKIEDKVILKAEDFCYHDPVDQSLSRNQGICLIFEEGGRIVFRLSGTGTSGATLRVYLEHYEQRLDHLDQDPEMVLSALNKIAKKISRLSFFLNREQPSVIT